MAGSDDREAQPDAAHTEQHGEKDIQECPDPVALLHEQERLEAEGGEGCVATQDADHEKGASPRREDQSSRFCFAIAGQQAHQDSSHHIHHHCAEGKLVAHPAGDEIRHSRAGDRSQGSTHADEQIRMPEQ